MDQPAEAVFPTDKLSALRLGRSLVAEVEASEPQYRAWIEIRPLQTDADDAAQRQGWTRNDERRSFRLTHCEYVTERLDSWDYDIGSNETKRTVATDEAALLTLLQDWGVAPDRFAYPWDTDFPA
ncbi:hypothetical protein ACBI99_43375 [Nonomuraea sp. ATR24]|uniref:hypothetical protein n=1 Tax=Nonomuraea sp. ATR24 TaxID=1676744 RepID=UPI0035C197AC